jgi:DNA replicative helicase MCM subunit Mcm2 (Cdc46/Mcm family)
MDPYDYNYAYQIEIGIRIPDLTMARYDLARRKADYLDEKEDYVRVKRELIDQKNKYKSDQHSFIAQYRFLKARETEVDANSSLKKYMQMSGVDPLILLSIKESIVKNHVEIEKLKYRILRNYIHVIDYCGVLSKQPLRNYLSTSQEVIEP